MSEAKQTRCPHCGSTFRVSDTQLAAKGGNVRCGSCLQVFRADLHIVGAAAVPAPVAVPDPITPPKPKVRSGFGEDESWALKLLGDDAGGDDGVEMIDDRNEDERITSRRINVEEPVEPSWNAGNNTRIRLDDDLHDMLDEGGDGRLTSDKAEDAVHVISATADESWAQSILSELEEDDKKAEAKTKNYGMEIIRDDKPAKAPPRNIKLAAALGEKVDPELLRAAQEASKPKPEPRNAPKSQIGDGTRPTPKDDELAFDDEQDALDFLNDGDLNLSGGGSAPAAGNTFSLSQPLADVDAPVELGRPARPTVNWKAAAIWGGGCALALALLGTQYLYFNFDRLASDPQGRSLLQAVCGPVGITLPDAPDASKLKVTDTSVRTDPQASGAVLVDALVSNSADFAQPFPALKVSFTDRNDQLIAGRVFQPKEYLHGEALHLRRIPPDTPVHISLAVINPGSNAVNTTIDPLF